MVKLETHRLMNKIIAAFMVDFFVPLKSQYNIMSRFSHPNDGVNVNHAHTVTEGKPIYR